MQLNSLPLLLLTLLLAAPVLAVSKEPASWYRPPTLSVMTAFIYEPLKPYTIQEWDKGLGSKFDANQWVADFKEVGATYLIFCDKWIDGFVFHDTKTTAFKSHRDFLREIADACHRGKLPLVLYFNTISDGNPEFDKWAIPDKQGKPITFRPNWPTRYQTLHSPFRQVCIEQVRELMTRYGRIDGMWLDIFSERLNTSSPWVAKAYEAMYGEPFDKASPGRLHEFNARTLESILQELQAIAAKEQPDCVWTFNGSALSMMDSGARARRLCSRLNYGSIEGHNFQANDESARAAWVLPKPIEIGMLLSKSWFTPLEDVAPPASMSEAGAIAATAIAVCQGANVYFALTPSHVGLFGEDLQRAKAVGAWFKKVQPLLGEARPYADVGIVLGTPSADGPGLPGGNPFWRQQLVKSLGAWKQAVAMSDDLARSGLCSQILLDSEQGGNWPASLLQYKAILLPELAVLDEGHAQQLREYVKAGGRLIAFGHSSLLDGKNTEQKDYALSDVFGARYKGQVAFPPIPGNTHVQADSTHSTEHQADNVIDGTATFWCSGGTPMPHWVEIGLAQPVDVAKVELVNPDGGFFQVADADVETYVDANWKTVASVRDASDKVVVFKIDSPVRTDKIRVKILRANYGGHDSVRAAAESIAVLDPAGRNWAIRSIPRLAVSSDETSVQQAMAEGSLSFLPMVATVEATSASVVAAVGNEQHSPAILRNRFGQGEALLLTTGEAALLGDAASWNALRRLAIGERTLSWTSPDRYRLILTEIPAGHALHVIDRQTGDAAYHPADVTITLDASRLGGVKELGLVGGEGTIKFTRDGNVIRFIVRPDPVASIMIR
jgi:hypothetical protein